MQNGGAGYTARGPGFHRVLPPEKAAGTLHYRNIPVAYCNTAYDFW
jgi:hypothetical protein